MNAMNKLVVQLPIDSDTDFDALLHVEETLSRTFGLEGHAQVDGHEIGEDRFSILIRAPDPAGPTLARITQLLEALGVLPAAVVASFRPATDSYEVVHPRGYAAKFVL
jgi:hypothetical protein